MWKVYYSDMTDCQKIKVASVNGARRVIATQVALDFPGACISDPDVVRLGSAWELYFVRHYVDRTEARVRSIWLTGDWPKQVPPNEKLFEVKK